jgi:hypothetical protein
MSTTTTTSSSRPTTYYSPQIERVVWEVLCNEISLTMQEDASEMIGKRIGARFVTRIKPPLPPNSSTLDTFKYFCKDIWMELYSKKVDRLQTNHRGVFMFTDVAFPPLMKLKNNHTQFLAIHKGIVSGALMNLGLEVISVSLEILPSTSIDSMLGVCFTVTLNKY